MQPSVNIPTPSAPTLPTLLAEHRDLMIQMKDITEDGTPTEQRMYEIEGKHLDGFKPATIADAAALLKWALARSSQEAWGDEIMRGEKDRPSEGEFNLFFREAWAVVDFLEGMVAADAAIVEAFGRWRQGLASVERRMDEAASEGRDADFDSYPDDDAVLEIFAMPAGGANGLAIKAYLWAWAEHAFNRSASSDPLAPLPPLDLPVPGHLPEQLLPQLLSEAVRLSPQLSAACPEPYVLRAPENAYESGDPR